jgi:hypothetical protein
LDAISYPSRGAVNHPSRCSQHGSMPVVEQAQPSLVAG